MKLPNHTKKWEMRATLNNAFKIMSLIKREMKFQDIRLGKIGDHICTNRRIKLRENRRNIKLFTNKHKVVTTFIHVSNDKGQRTVGESLGDPDLLKEQTKKNQKRFEPQRKHKSTFVQTKELWLSTHLISLELLEALLAC
jgi:hypothetical protein